MPTRAKTRLGSRVLDSRHGVALFVQRISISLLCSFFLCSLCCVRKCPEEAPQNSKCLSLSLAPFLCSRNTHPHVCWLSDGQIYTLPPTISSPRFASATPSKRRKIESRRQFMDQRHLQHRPQSHDLGTGGDHTAKQLQSLRARIWRFANVLRTCSPDPFAFPITDDPRESTCTACSTNPTPQATLKRWT